MTSPSAASARSRVSANTAFRKVTPRASRCWFMLRPGSSAVIRTCLRRHCSMRNRWGSTRRRKSCATCASTVSKCVRSTSTIPTGMPRSSPARSRRRACMRSTATWRTTCAPPTRCDWGSARSRDCQKSMAEASCRTARPATPASAISGYAPACRRASSHASPMPTPSARSVSVGARRCGRRRRSAASVTATTICRCSARQPLRRKRRRKFRFRANPRCGSLPCRSAKRS